MKLSLNPFKPIFTSLVPPSGGTRFPELDRLLRLAGIPALLVVLSLWAILPRLDAAPRPWNDELGYFCYLPALFSGQPFDLHMREHAAKSMHHLMATSVRTGKTITCFGVGTALGWLPFYTAAHWANPSLPLGSPPLWQACALGTVCYTMLGLLAVYATLLRFVNRWLAGGIALTMLLASPLLYYASGNPFFSHPFAFCLVAVLLYIAIRPNLTAGSWLACGLLVGLLADVRPQLAICALLPVALHRPTAKSAALFAMAALLALMPQMIYWHALFGSWLVNPQAVIDPHFFSRPAILLTLFSARHGLFTFHPLFALGAAGLLVAAASGRRKMALACLTIFLLQVIINSSAFDWWAGASFGNRRFCDTLPLIALGCGLLLAKFPKATPVLLVFAWWNVCLLAAFGTTLKPAGELNGWNINDVLNMFTCGLKQELFW